MRVNSSIVVPIVWTGREKHINISRQLVRSGQELTLLVFVAGSGNKAVNINLSVRHLAKNTISRVLVRGVLRGRSRVDFTGRVHIRRGAKNSDTWLESRFLLLSETASVRTVPNLEIAEKQVRAGHAATVGKIAESEIFYLGSRGLTRSRAVNLIARGFWESMIALLPEPSKDEVRQRLKL